MPHVVDKYVNPLTDFGFKKLFGEEPNKELLIDFSNQLLPQHQQIEDLEYAYNEKVGRTAADRKTILDLSCRSSIGEWFIVELQKIKLNWFKDRSIYYSGFPIEEQKNKGEWDFELQPVYFIGILDFVFSEAREEADILHRVEFKDQFCNVFYDKLKLIYIELPKFKKTVDELATQFEKWLYVFRHLSKLSDRPAALQERIFKRLFEAAEIANFTPAEMEAYKENLQVYHNLDNSSKTAREEAKREGRQEGLDEGREKGLQEGREEGKMEQMLAMTRMMKQNGESDNKISRCTGLTAAEIEKL